nr:MAG TPA: hypothetical protein [Caudoviricetes sp.]
MLYKSFVLCYVIDKAVKNNEWRPSAQIKRRRSL